MCVFSALRLGCRRCPGCSSHSRSGLGFRPTRNAVTMRFRIRIRAATVVVAGSVDYVVLGQVEDHARSITPQTRRLAHSSWSLSGWMCRNTHPSARARALASPTTTCHQEALQVIQPVNRCRSTNRCPVAIVEGGDELVTAELVRPQSLTALDHRLPVVGGELGVDPAGQPPRLATHACTRSGASQDEGSADGPPQLATNS